MDAPRGRAINSAPLRSLVRLYLVGMFFNNVLPSRLGGDVVRAHDASLFATTKTRSIASVLMDRSLGAVSVLVLGMVAISLSASRLPEVYLQVIVGFFELAFVVLFGALGVDEHVAIAMAMLRRLAQLALSLAGWVHYATCRFSR